LEGAEPTQNQAVLLIASRSSGSAPVDSVFGRTGAVTALQADYDGFFLTPAEGNAAYSVLGHGHTLADVSDSGALAALATVGTTEIDNSAVTFAKIANIATARILGRIAAGSGVVETLTGTETTSLLNNFTAALKGLAPLSGGGTTNFLRADGTWAAPPGGGGTPTDITVADESADTTCFPAFFTAATGDLEPKTNAGWEFDALLGTMTINGITIEATVPFLSYFETDAPFDEKFYRWNSFQGVLQLVAFQDDFLGGALMMSMHRDEIVAEKFQFEAPLFILEKAAAFTDLANYGQFWAKDDTPNLAYFTDDAGTDRPLGWNVMPVFEQDSSDTFDKEHVGMVWHKDVSGTITYTLVNDATIPLGATYTVVCDSINQINIAITGVSLKWMDGSAGTPPSGARTITQAGVATIYKYGNTEYWIWGNGIT
jgi:hypothetical protein